MANPERDRKNNQTLVIRILDLDLDISSLLPTDTCSNPLKSFHESPHARWVLDILFS